MRFVNAERRRCPRHDPDYALRRPVWAGGGAG
jgi:hypothetical protein